MIASHSEEQITLLQCFRQTKALWESRIAFRESRWRKGQFSPLLLQGYMQA